MRNVIEQSVVLPAPANTLFDMYLDPTAHAAITGYPVKIAAQHGAEFHAFDKQLSGEVLVVVRPRLIVQSWRSCKFHDDNPDSTLILIFTPDESNPSNGRIDLAHLDVPDHDYADVVEGWHKHYWNPWRAFLENTKGK